MPILVSLKTIIFNRYLDTLSMRHCHVNRTKLEFGALWWQRQLLLFALEGAICLPTGSAIGQFQIKSNENYPIHLG